MSNKRVTSFSSAAVWHRMPLYVRCKVGPQFYGTPRRIYG